MSKTLTLKDKTLYENPYRKCEAFGVEALTDAELLAIILRTGTKDMDALELAEELLTGHEDSLLNLIDLSVSELKSLPGIGRVKAMELKAITEIARRLSRAYYRHHLNYSDSASVASYYMEELRHEKQELLLVVLFDTKGGVIREKVITKGTLSTTLFPPREIFHFVIRENAAFFLLMHNHPSGCPNPSREDLQATKEIASLAEALNLCLIDHIIIGDRLYYSFREHDLI